MSAKAGPIKFYAVERVLAAAAALVCMAVTAILWQSLSQQQAMWPLPALYFLEVVAARLVGLWGIGRYDAVGSRLAWVTTGVLLGFTILGALSVFFFYLPVTGLLALAALWQARLAWRRLPLHIGLAPLGAVAQTALMLVVIRILYPAA